MTAPSQAGKPRVVVIGAGPAGMTAAHLLARSQWPVTVLEASQHIGGLARSFELWGQTVDVGPHRYFSGDSRVNAVWRDVVGDDFDNVSRLTRILYRDRFFQYPLRAFDALRKLGPGEAGLCLASYARQKLTRWGRPAPRTFEDWVVDRFGRRLYEMFFKTYSEKLWGIDCRSLDSDFAAQRIKKFSLGEAILSALRLSRQKHKTLLEAFAYPRGGTGMVYGRMAEATRQNGGVVALQRPVSKVLLEEGQCCGVETADGEVFPADWVVSTMPLTLLVQGLPDVPREARQAAAQLRFRNTILVYLQVEKSDLFADQWLYVHDPKVRLGRVTNFRNWSPSLHGGAPETILAAEYWCFDDDEIWGLGDEAIIDLARSEVSVLRLNAGAAIPRGFVLRLKRSYPVYETGYRERVEAIRRYLSGIPNLIPIGRYGSFKYNNQDHSILMGILASQKIMEGSGEDIWSVNTDYEEYQEQGRVEGREPSRLPSE